MHGLGFAGALADVGLPQQSIPLALLFFNLGVELGQLLFIAVVLLFAALMRKLLGERMQKPWAVTVPAYLIGGMASFWVIERVVGFWG